ncbi:MAG: hypothetical protein AB7H86_01280 [Blastocatellales bacterium]
MELIRWSTVLSDVRDLYFVKLTDDGVLRYTIETRLKEVYEVVLGNYCGPYVVVDEEHLTKYWSIKGENIGSTFEVRNSPLIDYFSGINDYDDYKHYVIATWDVCLEVLSAREPVIRRVENKN